MRPDLVERLRMVAKSPDANNRAYIVSHDRPSDEAVPASQLLTEAADAIAALTRDLEAAVALASDVLDETCCGHYLGEETAEDLTRWRDRVALSLGISSGKSDECK